MQKNLSKIIYTASNGGVLRPGEMKRENAIDFLLFSYCGISSEDTDPEEMLIRLIERAYKRMFNVRDISGMRTAVQPSKTP